MQEWALTHNGSALPVDSIPARSYEAMRSSIVEQCRAGARPLAYFAAAVGDSLSLYALLATDADSQILVARPEPVSADAPLASVTPELPMFHLFERELSEAHGIRFVGHPWLKGVRFPPGGRAGSTADYPFFRLEGEGVHEVAVGPVHAGVIEPGHFRFMCRGEKVDHLEIQLGYQHRGVEPLFEAGAIGSKAALAESICGTSLIAHATAYALCVEAAARGSAQGSAVDLRSETNGTVPRGIALTRRVALELERIGGHLASLGALAGDVAYLPGSSVCAGLRTLVINALLELSGSRFGRGLVRPGEASRLIDGRLADLILARLAIVERRLRLLGKVMWSSPSLLSRFERTGRVSTEDALAIGMVGVAARASGLDRDIRRTHPCSGEEQAAPEPCVEAGGDVFGRAMVRYREVFASIAFIRQEVSLVEAQGGRSRRLAGVPGSAAARASRFAGLGAPAADTLSIGMVEGVHGEIVHVLLTDAGGGTRRYKIKDPAFNNWFALALAVRGEGISDFPLCNKSFDLSYAGHDL